MSYVFLATGEQAFLHHLSAYRLLPRPRKAVLEEYIAIVIPRVASVQLVGAFARERDGKVLFHLAAEQQQGRVDVDVTGQIARFHGLIQSFREIGVIEDDFAVARGCAVYHELDVLIVGVRLELARGEVSAVIAVLDGIRINARESLAPVAVRGRLAYDTAVEPAREEKAHRNVADQLAFDRVGQQETYLLYRSFFVVLMGTGG